MGGKPNQKKGDDDHHKDSMPVIPLFTAITVYFGWGVLIFCGHVRDFFRRFFVPTSKPQPGYAPIVSDFEDFYTRRAYGRIHDCWNRPITSAPASRISVIERERVYHPVTGYTLDTRETGRSLDALNLGSYNYLGFGDNDSPTKESVLAALDKYAVSTCSARNDAGTTPLHRELETVVARYVGKEAAMIFGMGFGTNSTGLPALVGPGTLVISDELNHASIVVGARSSGAKIAVFKHSNVKDLERVIRKAIVEGQPRTHRPWRRIMIVVEGIYSMEGEFCPLAEIVALKKKYKCYLYVDEAHSIGAVGPTGKGVCDITGVDPADVDILMGTFTKSFGAVGGYLAADRSVIEYLRYHCMGSVYSPSISPPACQQIIAAMKIILGEDGTDNGKKRLQAIYDNANYFRDELRDYGFHVLGEPGSPVVPLMLYVPSQIKHFSAECLARNMAVVVVGFPATPLLLSRVRFCISAAHTRKDLEEAVKQIKIVGDTLGLRYAKKLC
jgi:serine palmitoyltransferase